MPVAGWLEHGVYRGIMLTGNGKTSARPPAVAGLFYPAAATQLRDVVAGYLDAKSDIGLPVAPKALIVPHAGYIYSGSVAAAAYASVKSLRQQIRRIVLLGPSHRVYLQGIAVPEWREFVTPLGDVRIDREQTQSLLEQGQVIASNAPHAQEHSLEVQLPFLQMLFEDFTLLPLVAGSATPQHVAAVLASVWGGAETLVLISSDLSHYHPYEAARQLDRATSAAILRCSTHLSAEQACGATCINGLTHLALRRKMQVREIVRLNSGDTAGDRSRVVGYGAFAIHEPERLAAA
jgi:MEMO1 family protein